MHRLLDAHRILGVTTGDEVGDNATAHHGIERVFYFTFVLAEAQEAPVAST